MLATLVLLEEQTWNWLPFTPQGEATLAGLIRSELSYLTNECLLNWLTVLQSPVPFITMIGQL